ncbi:MAG TPA: 2-phosphosulfolactate phosphatase [Chthoniobacteraceae bacterium]|nr:2-phosphosulfolactate phosphatase [Chthoniobacteraceae bacterium]
MAATKAVFGNGGSSPVNIDAALNPAEIAALPQRDLSATTCIVFDVLRATSSMITALEHGAAEIHPVRTIDEALALKAEMPRALLGGERHGELIPGFDIGNAPHEYTALAGRTIISTTTNGTIALRACEGARRVLVGALLNLDALAAELRRESPENVLLVCAGTFADFALEDAYAAGALIAKMETSRLTDAARATLALAQRFPDPIDVLRLARNGVALAEKGRGAEVEWCARQSVFKIVGEMQSAVIRPLAR